MSCAFRALEPVRYLARQEVTASNDDLFPGMKSKMICEMVLKKVSLQDVTGADSAFTSFTKTFSGARNYLKSNLVKASDRNTLLVHFASIR